MKDQGKDRQLSGKHRQLLKKDRHLFNQIPLCVLKNTFMDYFFSLQVLRFSIF